MNRRTDPRAGHPIARLIACLLAGALGGGTALATPSDDDRIAALQRQLAQVQAALQRLAQENRTLREHQRDLDRQLARLTAAQPQPASTAAPAGAAGIAPASPANTALPGAQAAPVASARSLDALRLWGYGEVYYIHSLDEPDQTRMDLARAVVGIGYRFDDRTEFNSEYELEHAVSSAGDVGEFEVEQFYVDRRLGEAVTARAGLFLMPFGFLNEHHEPTHFYGVQRNFVETLIIPSTWREGGFSLRGDTATGFGWSAGLTTGFDLAKWNFQPQFPPYASALELLDSGITPLQATHQELALANARRLSQYLALSYYGFPGLTLGAAVSSGKAVPAGPGDPRVTLWEAHARWQPSRWELSAIYARGTIGDLAATNAAHPGSPNPIPSSFYGYYVQGAYRLWERNEYRLVPFARLERYDLGAGFAGTAGPIVPGGLLPPSAVPGSLGFWPKNNDRVWTAGANLQVGPHLVLKGDYQWFRENSHFRRFDLGLGVAF